LAGHDSAAGLDKERQASNFDFSAKGGVLKTNKLKLASKNRTVTVAGIFSLIDEFELKGTAEYPMKIKIPFRVTDPIPKISMDKGRLRSYCAIQDCY
jgi:hypothetical protein